MSNSGSTTNPVAPKGYQYTVNGVVDTSGDTHILLTTKPIAVLAKSRSEHSNGWSLVIVWHDRSEWHTASSLHSLHQHH